MTQVWLKDECIGDLAFEPGLLTIEIDSQVYRMGRSHRNLAIHSSDFRGLSKDDRILAMAEMRKRNHVPPDAVIKRDRLSFSSIHDDNDFTLTWPIFSVGIDLAEKLFDLDEFEPV